MQKGNVAVAFILYALAVERLHSAYVVDGMADHRPDDEDNEIVNGVVRSLRETPRCPGPHSGGNGSREP
jgi:hypothetical protein